MAVAEGARTKEDAILQAAQQKVEKAKTEEKKQKAAAELAALELQQLDSTLRLARQLES